MLRSRGRPGPECLVVYGCELQQSWIWSRFLICCRAVNSLTVVFVVDTVDVDARYDRKQVGLLFVHCHILAPLLAFDRGQQTMNTSTYHCDPLLTYDRSADKTAQAEDKADHLYHSQAVTMHMHGR